MAKDSAVHWAPWLVASSAFAVIVISIAACVVAHNILNTPHFATVDHMVTVNMDSGMDWVAGVRVSVGEHIGGVFAGLGGLVSFTQWMGAVGMVGAAIALVGAFTSAHQLLILYVIVTSISSIAFLFFGITSAAFNDLIAPVLQRQTHEFCGQTTNPVYYTALACQPALPTPSTSCGDNCRDRVRFIQEMGGCPFLQTLCGTPTVVDTIMADAVLLAQVCIVAATFHLIASIFTCGFMFTLATNKKGSKGGHMVCFRMLCPCLKSKKPGYRLTDGGSEVSEFS